MTLPAQDLSRTDLRDLALNELPCLDPFNWPDFAKMVAMLYRRNGYVVAGVREDRPEGGCVMTFCKGGKKIIVQCQPWSVAETRPQSVRALYETQRAEKADRAILITSGVFTPEAERFAADKPLLLVDGLGCLHLAAQLHKDRIHLQSFPPIAIALGQCGQEQFGLN